MSQGHCLDRDQIRDLLHGRGGDTPATGLDDAAGRHIAGCEACQRLLQQEDSKETARWMASIGAEGLATEGGGAPFGELWPDLDEPEIRFPPSTRPGSLGRLDGYEIEERLGGGSMGVVFRARDVRLARPVALKVPWPQLAAQEGIRQRFEREARAASAAVHENLARTYSVGSGSGDFGLPYLVMELVEGESLRGLLDREGPPTPTSAAELTRQVALGLAAAHATGLIHRDVKPSNILIEATTGRPKLVDFGVAKAQDDAEARLTHGGGRVGTPAYMSPEQCTSGRPIDGRSDLFSLGGVLYELLTGERPFRGVTASAVMRQVEQEDPVPPRRLNDRIHRDLETICLKCLQKDPKARYASAGELAEELGRYLRGEPILARPTSRAERLARWAKRHPQLAFASAVAFGAVILVIALSIAFGASQYRAAQVIRREQTEALRQRDRADANLARARAAVDRMLTGVARERLDRMPRDLGQVRRQLLEDALAFQLEFARQDPQNPGLRLDVARARLRAADIQSWLGRPSDAEPAYRLALAELEPLEKALPGRLDVRRERAGGLHNLAHLLASDGRDREALDAYREALAIQEELAEASGEDEDIRGLVRSFDSLGSALTRSDRAEDVASALSALDRGRAVAEVLVARRPDSVEARTALAAVLHNLAAAKKFQGDLEAAGTALRRAIEILEPMVEEASARPNQHRLLASLLDLEAHVLADSGQPEEAERTYRSAVTRLESLSAAFPDEPRYRYDLASARTNLGNFLSATGRGADAESLIRLSRDSLAVLVSAQPDDYESREALAIACNTLGNCIRTRADGDRSEAEASFRQGLAALEGASGEASRRPDFRSTLAMLRHNLADLLRVTGRAGEAPALLEAAIEDERAAFEINPRGAHYRQALSDHYWTLAEVFITLGRAGDAARAAEAMVPLFPDRFAEAYYAAGFLSRCATIERGATGAQANSRLALADTYASRAVQHLRSAIARGFADSENLQTAETFAPLRDREDFGEVMSLIRKNSPPKNP